MTDELIQAQPNTRPSEVRSDALLGALARLHKELAEESERASKLSEECAAQASFGPALRWQACAQTWARAALAVMREIQRAHNIPICVKPGAERAVEGTK